MSEQLGFRESVKVLWMWRHEMLEDTTEALGRAIQRVADGKPFSYRAAKRQHFDYHMDYPEIFKTDCRDFDCRM